MAREAANIAAVDLHHAGIQIVEAREQARNCGFAGSRGTNQRRRLSRFDAEAHIAQDRRPRFVVEEHSFELNVPLEWRSRPRTRQVADLAVGFEDFADALIPHGRPGVAIGRLGEVLHGFVHLAQVEDEHDERTGGEGAIEHHVSAKPQDHAGADSDDDFYQRRQFGLHAAGAQCDLHAFEALFLETMLLEFLSREGLHHPNRGEDFLNHRDNFALLLAHLAGGPLNSPRIGIDFPDDVAAGSAMGWFIGDYVHSRRHNRSLEQKPTAAQRILNRLYIGPESR